jgi:aryl-alcohol dehydrogenase-like predicted oxidoreductase
MGLGMAALGRPGYITLGHAGDLGGAHSIDAMRAHSHEVLDAAWQSGIRYFDAARSYGLAEQFLGDWLKTRRIPADQVMVSSKWGYTYTANWQVDADVHEVKAHTLPVLQRQWQESQTFLGSYLGLYQIHSATLDSGVFENTAVLSELAALKANHVAIGLTVSGPQQGVALRRALEIQIDGRRLFDSVQATWNILEQSTSAALAEVHAAGLAVVIKEALANGRLTSRNTDPAFATKRTILERQAARLETTLDALALAAVLAQPWVNSVLSGATTVDQLKANLKALDLTWDAEAAAAVIKLVETPDVYWSTRRALAWN